MHVGLYLPNLAHSFTIGLWFGAASFISVDIAPGVRNIETWKDVGEVW